MGLFFTVALAIWSVMNAYVVWRASSVPLVARHVPGWVLLVAGALLWSSYLLSRFLERVAPAAASPMEVIGSTWIGVVFLAFVALLAADLVTGFGLLVGKISVAAGIGRQAWTPAPLAPSIRGWALLVAGVLSAIATVQAHRAPAVRDFEVKIANLPAQLDGTVIVAASDLHIGTLLDGDWLQARIAQIDALRPHMIVLLGDIIEGDSESERQLVPVLRRLSAPLGVWAVTGNHEGYGRRTSRQSLLEEAGFQVLHDRWTEAAPGLLVAGVDDLTSRRRLGVTGNFVARALAGRPPGAATVFLSHTPWDADKAAAAGAGLMLSGHTHNGQIWPFNYFVRRTYPMIAGRYEINGMPLIVCRGTGTWGPRMRLWYPSELLSITLRAPQ